MTVASETREAVRSRPFLHAALRAGVVNYTAAARYLDVGDQEAVAAALRRYAEDLPPLDPETGDVRVDMRGGVGPVPAAEALLAVGDLSLGPDGGDLTAVVATGDVGPDALRRVLARLDVADVPVRAAAAGEAHLVVVVRRRAGIDALRHVEDALGA